MAEGSKLSNGRDTSRNYTRLETSPNTQSEDEDEAYKGWKHLVPFRTASKNPKTLPVIYAGPLNYGTQHWANSYVYKAYKHGLNEDDLYDTPRKDSAERNADRFERLWNEEVTQYGEEKASVFRTIYKMIKSRFYVAVILNLLLNCVALLRALYFLKELLDLVQTPGSSFELQIAYVLLLLLTTVIRTQMLASVFVVGSLSGIRARGGVLSTVFKKILTQQLQNTNVGNLVNLCANDGQRLYEAILFAPFLFSSIPTIAAAIYCIYLLGPWGILGFAIFYAFLPFQFFMSRVVYKFRGRVIPITEERVKLMSEIVTAIKLVKMYAWEKSFAAKIQEVRGRERRALDKCLMSQSVLSSLPILVPIFVAALTFLAMTLTRYDITVTQAFVYIALLNSLRLCLGLTPYALKSLAEGYHVCGRFKALLLSKEENMEISAIQNAENLIEIRNGYFGWQPQVQMDNKASGMKKNLRAQNYGSVANGVRATAKTGKKNSELQPLFVDTQDVVTETVVTLHDITVSLKHGTLLGVCGSVGSGKTSLMQAILGMMRKEGGKIAVDGSKSLAYVAQQAWIMNATVKENIIFGKEFDEGRYYQVVEACALLSDFEQLTAGDQTEIGERGINLSGGQKQRISIARAVYSDSDLVLLDDPLSAVDALVGEHIFTNCLKGLLANKTVLFVTHQLQFLTGCDYVLVMKDGRIAEEGTHETLMKNDDGEYSSLIRSFHDSVGEEKLNGKETVDHLPAELAPNMEKRHNLITDPTMPRNAEEYTSDKEVMKEETKMDNETEKTNSVVDAEDARKIRGKLTKAEQVGQEKIKLSTFTAYMRASGGLWVFPLVMLILLIYTALQTFANYWISVWIDGGSGGVYINETVTVNGTEVTTLVLSERIIDNPRMSFYQIVYGLSLIVLVGAAALNARSYMMFCLRASTSLHDQIFRKLVSSPMSFFDVTTSGQIMNRFSKDMDESDTNLPFQSDQFFRTSAIILGSFTVIIIITPYFLLVLIPIALIFIFSARFCQKGIQLSKRLENVTKSPLFSHIATTVQGLATIRAYKKEDRFLDRFNYFQDRNSMAQHLFDVVMRWSSVRLTSISLLITLVTFLFISFVPLESVTPSMMALALTYALSIGDMLQFTVIQGIESSARFTSVERIQNYIENLVSEAPGIVEHNRPKESWPEEGAIKFDNADVRYREGLPLVLKSISLDIKPQEKIGIVGRTGSGKSSLALTLFRIMELAGGSITIDNVDISTIGLEDLRSKLSIIPQDPVLFVGTVRYNLDPFGVYRDEELWSALKKCHVKHTITALDGQLDALIVENGENFSVGERQLLCMARALLRHSKVLLLDEATAAIDTETDSLIQDTIKEAFADCTMLTIAHRLNTVSNYDRILVLDDGKVIEFDTPEVLLTDTSTMFSQMMKVQESQKMAAVQNSSKI